MKFLKYNIFKLTVLITIIHALTTVLTSYTLIYLIVSDTSMLIKNLILILFIYFTDSVFMFLKMKFIANSKFNIQMDLRQKIDKYISDMSYFEFMKKDYGMRLSLYINDIDKIIELNLDKFISIISSIALAIFTLISLFMIHYSMVIIAVLSLIIMVFAPNIFQKKLSMYITGSQVEKEIYLSKMREYLQGFKTFLENSNFKIFLKKSRETSFKYSEYALKGNTFAATMSAVLTFVNYASTFLSLGILSYLVIIGKVKSGTLLAVLGLLPNFGASVMMTFSELAFYKSGNDLYKEKFNDLDNENYIEEQFYKKLFAKNEFLDINLIQHNYEKIESINSIELKNIEVDYDNMKIKYPKNILFEKGKKYIITGNSGVGKSTLLKVILGEIENYSGEVFINGKKRNINPFDYISYVNQQTFLFNDTLKNNIDPDNILSSEEVDDLIRFMKIENMNSEYIIEDNGENLSGGQKQRIQIARALVRNKKIFILDEATSNVDKETSDFIENLILKKDCMVIMITHHLTNETEKLLDKKIEL